MAFKSKMSNLRFHLRFHFDKSSRMYPTLLALFRLILENIFFKFVQVQETFAALRQMTLHLYIIMFQLSRGNDVRDFIYPRAFLQRQNSPFIAKAMSHLGTPVHGLKILVRIIWIDESEYTCEYPIPYCYTVIGQFNVCKPKILNQRYFLYKGWLWLCRKRLR